MSQPTCIICAPILTWRCMLRNDWTFEYRASLLSEASRHREDYHRSRLEWWRTKKDEVLGTIRSEGLEIDEKLVLEHPSPKARDWHDATRVTVRTDLRNDLDECLKKLAFHTNELRAYVGWREVLSANPEARLSLDHEDWQFFFSKPDSDRG